MTGLRVIIDRAARKAVFSGPGTFAAKDEIKKLGLARWNSGEKAWEVSAFTLSLEELSDKFPDIEIKENATQQSPSLEAEEFDSSDKVVPSNRVSPGLPASVSVSEFILKIRGLLKAAFPNRLFIHGVLSSVKKAKGGRVFLELVEADRPDERVSCVIWRDEERICKPLLDAGFKLEADLQVLFEVEVDLNRRWCGVSLNIHSVVAEYTIAKAAALRDRTNERLKAEGLFDQNKKRTLPFLPRRLGILTSSGGTVINDFRASLDRARFGFELFWVNSSVQGSDAKAEIIGALQQLSQIPHLDAVLVFRGGGSPADLAVFNDYEVAKAICLCSYPVVSAIGHQEDQCSVQDVSSIALGVPKDIGRYFADIVRERRQVCVALVKGVFLNSSQVISLSQERTRNLSAMLNGLVVQRLGNAVETLARFDTSLPIQATFHLKQSVRQVSIVASPIGALAGQAWAYHLSRMRSTVSAVNEGAKGRRRFMIERLFAAVRHLRSDFVYLLERYAEKIHIFDTVSRFSDAVCKREAENLDALASLIEAAAPETQLKRGYTMVRRADDGTIVTNSGQIRKNDNVEIEFVDARRNARILSG